MELTISVSAEVETILAQRASAAGKDLKTFAEEIVATQATRLTLDEILAPVRQDFAASGMTEDELAELIKSERRAMWEEKHAQRA